MLDFSTLPILLAQAQEQTAEPAGSSSLIKFLIFLGVVLLVFVLPFLIGSFLAGTLRMREYGFKIGVVLSTLFLALFVLGRAWNPQTRSFDIPLGVDLKGGVILIYEVDTANTAGKKQGKQAKGQEDDGAGGIDMQDLVQALTNRINPSGTKEIVIRPYGDRQVEIIIPEVETEEVENIKKQIRTAGQLEFRIVANTRDHERIIAAAEAQSKGPNRYQKNVYLGGDRVGFWAEAAAEKLKVSELTDVILRDQKTGRMISSLSEIGQIDSSEELLADFLKKHAGSGIEKLDVLLATDDGCNVTGDHLGVVARGNDDLLNPCVTFRLKGVGATLFGELTRKNRPDKDTEFYRHLGIMLDERLLSFPRLITTITDSGQITGNFTPEEVDFLVGILRAGRLPATLKDEPITENHIGSMLGDDTIRKGKYSIVISLVAVLAFVALYYRFSGLVACAALLLNLILIMALMVLLNAPLTLPGLAGLVLTIGMSVDANVLIFERIREETERGAALRMAIRNGFDRATTTIVDANVTTLITAMVLYAIGTDQIRGFAVTLIFGIVMSMYTAIFCSRIVFDIAERRRWITQLRMSRIVGATHMDFIGKRQLAVGLSLLLILVGLVAVGLRGREIFDIDFNGGTSVTMVLQEPKSPDDVRSTLNDYFQENFTNTINCTVNTVGVEDRQPNTVYKIDTNIEDVRELENAIKQAFQDPSGKKEWLAYDMSFDGLKEQQVSQEDVMAPAANTPAAKTPAATVPAEDTGTSGTDAAEKATTPPANPPAEVESGTTEPKTEPAKSEPAKSEPAKSEPAKSEPAKSEPGTTEPKTEPAKSEAGTTEPAKTESDGATSRRRDLPGDNVVAWTGPVLTPLQEKAEGDQDPQAATTTAQGQPEGAAPEQPAAKQETESTPDATAAKEQSKPAAGGGELATDSATAGDITAPPAQVVRTIGHVKLGEKMNTPTLRDKLRVAYNELFGQPQTTDKADSTTTGGGDDAGSAQTQEVPGLIVGPDQTFNWDQKSGQSNEEWYVSMALPRQQAAQVLQRMQSDLADTPVFPQSSKIGSKVAGDTQTLAIWALIGSLFGIVGYIWIRFQRVVFGVAAVIALVHDVLITLGAIAISAYLAKALGFLLIEEFRISLPIVAAFLTIIGYSLNDTIVVFDRIREVRGKSPDLTSEMINTSINQTLSRTLLTSLTTLIVVAILYAIGGQGIHGFAFALVVGVVVGTYSSIFIASPALLWMFNLNRTAK